MSTFFYCVAIGAGSISVILMVTFLILAGFSRVADFLEEKFQITTVVATALSPVLIFGLIAVVFFVGGKVASI